MSSYLAYEAKRRLEASSGLSGPRFWGQLAGQPWLALLILAGLCHWCQLGQLRWLHPASCGHAPSTQVGSGSFSWQRQGSERARKRLWPLESSSAWTTPTPARSEQVTRPNCREKIPALWWEELQSHVRRGWIQQRVENQGLFCSQSALTGVGHCYIWKPLGTF